MFSLRTRLLAAATLVLTAFIVLSGAGLERAFREAALESQFNKMQGVVYALLGVTEPDENGRLSIREMNLPDPRLRQPGSGLDAALIDETGHTLWHSPSFPMLPLPSLPDVGQFFFEQSQDPEYFLTAFGVRWIDAQNQARRYTVVIFENSRDFEDQLTVFRRTLWLTLGLSALALLMVLLAVLHWGLLPLRKLVRQLSAIEQGQQSRIEGEYPKELAPLAASLNAMVAAERHQQSRYRNALGDLAHSLKTPLAVLRGGSEAPRSTTDATLVQEQVSRMQHIVDYQLKRAATAGSRTLSEPVLLKPLAEKICGALHKVYADKRVTLVNLIPAELKLRADQGDLYELLGNLLDNACKYGRSKVSIRAVLKSGRCQIDIEDDGPGLPQAPELLLERGVRADNQTQGQGIGLAAAAELVRAYGGTLTLGRSPLGGAQISITL